MVIRNHQDIYCISLPISHSFRFLLCRCHFFSFFFDFLSFGETNRKTRMWKAKERKKRKEKENENKLKNIFVSDLRLTCAKNKRDKNMCISRSISSHFLICSFPSKYFGFFAFFFFLFFYFPHIDEDINQCSLWWFQCKLVENIWQFRRQFAKL